VYENLNTRELNYLHNPQPSV